jgi:hypothetical protein
MGWEDIVHEMPQPSMHTSVVLDSSILDEHQVMEMLVELEVFQYLPDGEGAKLERVVQRFKQLGKVWIPVVKITEDFPIGPTLHLSNEPADVQFTIPWKWVRYVFRVPEGEGKFKFALGFA